MNTPDLSSRTVRPLLSRRAWTAFFAAGFLLWFFLASLVVLVILAVLDAFNILPSPFLDLLLWFVFPIGFAVYAVGKYARLRSFLALAMGWHAAIASNSIVWMAIFYSPGDEDRFRSMVDALKLGVTIPFYFFPTY